LVTSTKWNLGNEGIILFDTYHSCIEIPIGHRANFFFLFPLKYYKYLKMNDVIMLFSTMIKFCLIKTNISSQNIAFLSMFSNDLSELWSTAITKQDIIKLDRKVIELVALFEGLTPTSEHLFNNHALTELPMSIFSMGNLRSQSAMAGERPMKFFKKLCPEGGVNYDSTLIKKFRSLEENNFNNYLNLSPPKSIYMMSDHYIKLMGKPKTYKFNRFELQYIIEMMIIYIESFSMSNALEYNVYRLYVCYKAYNDLNNGNISFINWLLYAYNDWVKPNGIFLKGVRNTYHEDFRKKRVKGYLIAGYI
jgi:hypothetical protein